MIRQRNPSLNLTRFITCHLQRIDLNEKLLGKESSRWNEEGN